MFAKTKPFSGFAVDDLDAARQFYGETIGLGVSAMSEYLIGLAWFKDPAGNVLSVLQDA